MNRYTRINDLLGRHASKSFHTDKTIDKYLNRKTKYKNKIIKDHQKNDKQSNKSEYNYELEYHTSSESESDSQNSSYIDELENELIDELSFKSKYIEFKPLNKEYKKENDDLYVFNSDDLEIKLHYLSTKYTSNMKQLQIIKQYLELEKDFLSGRLNLDDIKKLKISQTIQYHLIYFQDNPLYTKDDYMKLKNELDEYKKIIDRYQKSIQILNNNNNIDDLIEDNNNHLYDELINIFS
jgi:hypothetical protein